jgi:DNA replication initiation complex subunit (GINS family)
MTLLEYVAYMVFPLTLVTILCVFGFLKLERAYKMLDTTQKTQQERTVATLLTMLSEEKKLTQSLLNQLRVTKISDLPPLQVATAQQDSNGPYAAVGDPDYFPVGTDEGEAELYESNMKASHPLHEQLELDDDLSAAGWTSLSSNRGFVAE